MTPMSDAAPATLTLHAELRALISSARLRAAQAVNSAITLLYWEVGARIRRDVLKSRRADYGKWIVTALAGKLTAEFGAGFSRRNLFNMVKFAELFPEAEKVQTLSALLGWSHFTLLLRVDDPIAREFYAEMGRLERWSVRTMQAKIESRLFLRTALSKKPAILAQEELAALHERDQLTPDLVFRDPYILDFLGLHDSYSEKDLEAAILREIEAFLLELGGGFAFVARQKRMSVDGVDHYLDLLFFHRRLKRLIAVELKLGDFHPGDKGQMELYLAWLKENETIAGEEPPLGLILCAGKNEETVRLLGMNTGQVRVASYVDRIVPQQELKRRLHAAVRSAREQVAVRPSE